jgi:hypothetical protein
MVDGAPEIHLLAADPDDHLVEMPLHACAGTLVAETAREYRSELENPASDRLVGNVETTVGEPLLDVSVARGEPEIQPNGVLDDEAGEAMPAIARRDHPAILYRPSPPAKSP